MPARRRRAYDVEPKARWEAEDAWALIRVLGTPEQRALLRERPPAPWG
jgi:hypothetical protein